MSSAVVASLTVSGSFGHLAVGRDETLPPAETQPQPEPSYAAEAPQKADSSDETPTAVETIDFARDIQPIFAAHCLKCHGAQRHSSGLRLDSRMLAKAGGDSGRPIVGGTLETNELVARVASHERTYRMPKNAEPLDSREIEHLKLWVEQGSQWPDASDQLAVSPNLWFFDRWLTAIGQFVTQHQFEYRQVWPFIIAFLAAQLSMLVVLRARRDTRRTVRGHAARLIGSASFRAKSDRGKLP